MPAITNANGLGWTAQMTLPGPNTATNVATLAWAATTAFVAGQVITLANGDMHLCVTSGTTGGSQPTWATTITRQDTVNLVANSNVVTDAAILASDAGRPVSQFGIPSNSYVGTVSAGVSFLLSASPASQVAGPVAMDNKVGVLINLGRPSGPTGNTTVDSGATWQLIGEKFYNAYSVKGQDYVNSPPTRQDLTINQKPA